MAKEGSVADQKIVQMVVLVMLASSTRVRNTIRMLPITLTLRGGFGQPCGPFIVFSSRIDGTHARLASNTHVRVNFAIVDILSDQRVGMGRARMMTSVTML